MKTKHQNYKSSHAVHRDRKNDYDRQAEIKKTQQTIQECLDDGDYSNLGFYQSKLKKLKRREKNET